LAFVLTGNVNRPNGGIYERFKGLPVPTATFDGATPNTMYKMTDIAIQYDGYADFPQYPLNIGVEQGPYHRKDLGRRLIPRLV
jgi:hypothetical protein